MQLNIEQCHFQIAYQGKPPPQSDIWQQRFCQMLPGAVYSVIRDACAAAGIAPTASITLPDIALNLPPVDYVLFDRAPAAYLQHYLLPVLREQLAPILATSPATATPPPDPASDTVADATAEPGASAPIWSDVEAALLSGQGPLAASGDTLIAALLRALTSATPPPLRRWLLLPLTRRRLWSALRQAGWATQIPVVLQAMFPESQVQPLLPSLLTQGLSLARHLALWETALSVLSDPSFSPQDNVPTVLRVQSFALLNHTSLSDSALQHYLTPLRRWLAQSPYPVPAIQSWLAITRVQGIRDPDLTSLDRLLAMVSPSDALPEAAPVPHPAAVPSLTTWRTFLSQLLSLQKCHGDPATYRRQVLSLLNWLDACDPPLDPVVLQPIVNILQRVSAEIADSLPDASARLPQVEAWLQAISAGQVPPADDWSELQAVLCADHSLPHQLQAALLSLSESAAEAVRADLLSVLRAARTLLLLRESPTVSCSLPLLSDPVALAGCFDTEAWSVASSAANLADRLPVVLTTVLWQTMLPPTALAALSYFSHAPAAASQERLVSVLHNLAAVAANADHPLISPDDVTKLKTWYKAECAILHDVCTLIESVLTIWQQDTSAPLSVSLTPVCSGLTQLLQQLRSQPGIIDRISLLRLTALLSLLLSSWRVLAADTSDPTTLRTLATRCRTLQAQLSALDKSLLADFSQYEGWWLPLVSAAPDPTLSPLLLTLTNHLTRAGNTAAEAGFNASMQHLQTIAASHDAAKESLALLTRSQQQTQTLLTSCHLPEAIQRVQDFITLSQQVQTKQQGIGWTCQDAGLVLLWPHLRTLFARLALLDEDAAFVDDAARLKAQALLIALLDTEPCSEMWCVANVLVGLPADTLISEPVSLSADELNQVDQLLTSVIAQWSALKQMSLPAFRTLFLLREGTLFPDVQDVRLEVTQHPADVLLSKLPWGIGIIALPWLPSRLLRVDWPDGLN